MSDNLLIRLENDRDIITIGGRESTLLLLPELEGFDSADFSVSMKSSGYLDGGYISKARIDSRTLTIKADIPLSDAQTMEATRQRLIKNFKPQSDIKVTVTRGNAHRWISGRTVSFKITERTGFVSSSSVDMEILCPDPYWRDISDYGKNIAEITPLLHTPLAIPTGGIAASVKATSDSVVITNSGHVPCGLTVRLVINDTVVNPVIENQSTGQYIRIIDTFAAGDEVVISAVPRNKTVTKNGANHIQKADRSSVFSDFLPVGDSIIRYDADDGYNNMDVYLYYTPLYLGV